MGRRLVRHNLPEYIGFDEDHAQGAKFLRQVTINLDGTLRWDGVSGSLPRLDFSVHLAELTLACYRFKDGVLSLDSELLRAAITADGCQESSLDNECAIFEEMLKRCLDPFTFIEVPDCPGQIVSIETQENVQFGVDYSTKYFLGAEEQPSALNFKQSLLKSLMETFHPNSSRLYVLADPSTHINKVRVTKIDNDGNHQEYHLYPEEFAEQLRADFPELKSQFSQIFLFSCERSYNLNAGLSLSFAQALQQELGIDTISYEGSLISQDVFDEEKNQLYSIKGFHLVDIIKYRKFFNFINFQFAKSFGITRSSDINGNAAVRFYSESDDRLRLKLDAVARLSNSPRNKFRKYLLNNYLKAISIAASYCSVEPKFFIAAEPSVSVTLEDLGYSARSRNHIAPTFQTFRTRLMSRIQ